MRAKLEKLDPLHSCPQCEGYAPLAKAFGAQCPVARQTERWRKESRAKLRHHLMRTTDSEFDSLVSDYGRIARLLASNGDKIGDDWPARAGILAEVVLDARNRVAVVEMRNG